LFTQILAQPSTRQMILSKGALMEGEFQAVSSSQGEEASDRSKDELSVVIPKEAGEESEASLSVNDGAGKVGSMYNGAHTIVSSCCGTSSGIVRSPNSGSEKFV